MVKKPTRKFWHFLKENATTKLPVRFTVFDCETQEHPGPFGDVDHKLWFGIATFFTLEPGNWKKTEREQILFKSSDEFWDFIDEHTEKRGRLIISAHNLAFDFLVSRSIPELEKRHWEIEFPITNHGHFIAKAKRKNSTLWFLDTMNYIPTSLKALGHSLGLEKLQMPPRSAPFADWDRYCRRDCDILEQFWRYLIQFLRENDFGSFAPTAAGLAMKVFRHRFMSQKLLIHANTKALELERAGYYGGRTECWRIGSCGKQDYYKLDINSMYPYVMQAFEYPARIARFARSKTVDQLRDLCKRFFVIARVGLETDESAYPKRGDFKLLFPIGRFETTLCSPELEYALAHNHVRYVGETACYYHERIFKSYVTQLYALRLKYKHKGFGAFELFCKLLLNSLYGKFGQKGYVREEMPVQRGVRFGYESIYSATTGKQTCVYYWFGRGIAEREEGEAFNSMPALAAAVTSYARMTLWRLICKAGQGNVYYCDTDSLIVNQDGYDNLIPEIAATRLGALKVEETANDLHLWGPKDYEFGSKVVIKGLPPQTQLIPGSVAEISHFYTFSESLQHGLTESVRQTTVRKKLARAYGKGLVGTDGAVAPFSLADF